MVGTFYECAPNTNKMAWRIRANQYSNSDTRLSCDTRENVIIHEVDSRLQCRRISWNIFVVIFLSSEEMGVFADARLSLG